MLIRFILLITWELWIKYLLGWIVVINPLRASLRGTIRQLADYAGQSTNLYTDVTLQPPPLHPSLRETIRQLADYAGQSTNLYAGGTLQPHDWSPHSFYSGAWMA
jgi:hypothetical protein